MTSVIQSEEPKGTNQGHDWVEVVAVTGGL